MPLKNSGIYLTATWLFLKNWTLNRLEWLDDSLFCPYGDIVRPGEIETKVYPNPFVDYFYYNFALNKTGKVSLELYDIKGARISSIIDGVSYPEGSHSIDWEASEIAGSIYLLILKVDGEVVSVQKLVKL